MRCLKNLSRCECDSCKDNKKRLDAKRNTIRTAKTQTAKPLSEADKKRMKMRILINYILGRNLQFQNGADNR